MYIIKQENIFSIPEGKPHGDIGASSLYPNRHGWNANHTIHDEGTTSNPLCNLYIGSSIGALVVLRPIYHCKSKCNFIISVVIYQIYIHIYTYNYLATSWHYHFCCWTIIYKMTKFSLKLTTDHFNKIIFIVLKYMPFRVIPQPLILVENYIE